MQALGGEGAEDDALIELDGDVFRAALERLIDPEEEDDLLAGEGDVA